jgi:hypothetical protein
MNACPMLVVVAVSLTSALVVSAQDASVQPTTYTSPLSQTASGAKSIRFAQQPTVVGDQVTQKVGMELELRTVIKQSGQTAHDSTTNIRRRQQRTVEVLEVANGRARRARVTYPLSRELTPENPDPNTEAAQPVEGKSYLITRSDEQLLVTDAEGAIPARREYEIVVNSMETFGKPSPLAEFLLHRELHLGDRLEVPRDLAAEMMGFDQFGSIERFELTVDAVRVVDGRTCVLFTAVIATQGDSDDPLRVTAEGTIAVELATTRTVQATLRGPLTLTTVEHEAECTATGAVLVAIHSYYR